MSSVSYTQSRRKGSHSLFTGKNTDLCPSPSSLLLRKVLKGIDIDSPFTLIHGRSCSDERSVSGVWHSCWVVGTGVIVSKGEVGGHLCNGGLLTPCGRRFQSCISSEYLGHETWLEVEKHQSIKYQPTVLHWRTKILFSEPLPPTSPDFFEWTVVYRERFILKLLVSCLLRISRANVKTFTGVKVLKSSSSKPPLHKP